MLAFFSLCLIVDAGISTLGQSQAKNKGQVLLLGTAYLGDDEVTTNATMLGLETGWTGFDTGNREEVFHPRGLVKALDKVFRSKKIKREWLVLQIKLFIPEEAWHKTGLYDVADAFEEAFKQMQDLFAPATDFFDTVLLCGGPPGTQGALVRAWDRMGKHVGKSAGALGLCNVTIGQLSAVFSEPGQTKPAIVQNKLTFTNGFDRKVRDLCSHNMAKYQAYSSLAGKSDMYRNILRIAGAVSKEASAEQIYLSWLHKQSIYPVVSTKDMNHMQDNLGAKNVKIVDEVKIRFSERLQALEEEERLIAKVEKREMEKKFDGKPTGAPTKQSPIGYAYAVADPDLFESRRVEPTPKPTTVPTHYPTGWPTYPTVLPTRYPTKPPTKPTHRPTRKPTQRPTQAPKKPFWKEIPTQITDDEESLTPIPKRLEGDTRWVSTMVEQPVYFQS